MSFPPNHEIATQIVSCAGEKSCKVHLDESYFTENPMAENDYFFVNAVCRNTEIVFNSGNDKYEIKKEIIASIAAICDIVGIFIFVFGIAAYSFSLP